MNMLPSVQALAIVPAESKMNMLPSVQALAVVSAE